MPDAHDMKSASARPLRVAVLAPVSWPVPPAGYGPWEQVCSNLTEGLVARGHEVTLFAAPGSHTTGRLVETVEHPFGLWPPAELEREQRHDPETGLLVGPPNFRALEQQHIAACMEAACGGAFDVVHSHLHVHALVFSRLLPCPMVSTLHGSAWVQADHAVLHRYREQPFVSISDAERAFKPDLNYVATVYNGIRTDLYAYCAEKDDYLLFSGRFAPEKGVAEAVQIAQAAGMPLRLAGMIEPRHRAYFDAEVRPFIDDRNVTYLGLLSQDALRPHYQRARALLCPIHWAEPFGLVAVEAMACGTPMIGARRGAFREIVREGRNGFLFDTTDDAVAAVARLDRIEPAQCRAEVEARFSADVMTAGYEAVYRRVIAQRQGTGE